MQIDQNKCRCCSSPNLTTILDLGNQPLANSLPKERSTEEERFPLTFALCTKCGLYQIRESVPPEKLFSNYVYRSSFSDTMQAHVRTLADRLINERGLDASSLVMEAASNDGYLLKNYLAAGIPVVGVEPAVNIAEIAEAENKVPTETEFFSSSFVEDFVDRRGRVDVFHAHNVLAHTPEPGNFIAAIKNVLKPTGIAVIEAPYVRNLIESCAFDTIYHEHFSYLSATSVHYMADAAGLKLIDVEATSLHGGSLLYFLAHKGTAEKSSVRTFLDAEKEIGLNEEGYAKNFSRHVEALCKNLRTKLESLKEQGKTVAAYGASAKGSTLLNFLGEQSRSIKFVVDRSPLKQNSYMPGIGVPIQPTEALTEKQPDFALLLSWNFEAEIVQQQRTYLERGGCFLVPVPDVREVRISDVC